MGGYVPFFYRKLRKKLFSAVEVSWAKPIPLRRQSSESTAMYISQTVPVW